MLAAGETVGLAEWIIDDTCLVIFLCEFISIMKQCFFFSQVSPLSIWIASVSRQHIEWKQAVHIHDPLDRYCIYPMGRDFENIEIKWKSSCAKQSLVYEHDQSVRLNVLLRLPGYHLWGDAQGPDWQCDSLQYDWWQEVIGPGRTGRRVTTLSHPSVWRWEVG